LEELNLSNCPISDAGLAVLRELPELRRLNLFWNGAVTDAGIGHVRECHKLERINLMGTSTGDGALRALSGKPSLMHFQSGNGMTDAGVRLLHEIPSFVEWRGVEPRLGLLGYLPDATHVSMRGSITDRGMESLVGLDGLFGLNIDQSGMAVTPAGLRPLVKLAHLGFLAYDATDEAMPIIASLPHLRRLGCQDTTAG